MDNKVIVQLTVDAEIEISDTGYLGDDVSVKKHVVKALADARGWRYFVQRGVLEPKQIPVKVQLKQVTIIPLED